MTAVLLFQLQAPMAAFGSVAPGERRETLESPGHAALAGCLAAALGLERIDPRLERFSAALAFAVRVDQLGPMVADYHTAEVPKARRDQTWLTRREELARKGNTILSRRDYRFSCAYTVAAMIRMPAQEPDIAPLLDLSALVAALKAPKFTLYLGRKSCPLGAPPLPVIAEAPRSLHDALAEYDRSRAGHPCDFRTPVDLGLFADDAFIEAGLLDVGNMTRRIERRDVLLSRRAWRFDRRSVAVFPIGTANAAAPAGENRQ